MKRKFIKVLSLIVCGLFIAMAFTGCDRKGFEGGSDNNTVVSEPIPMPSLLTFRAAGDSEYSSISVEAVVLPANASDKSVNWSVTFADPSSDWATGKAVADYLTVIPTSSGSAKATIKCLQPFGEQIIVTVSSVSNPTAKASCTIDFLQRIKFLSFNGELISDVLKLPFSAKYFSLEKSFSNALIFSFADLPYTMSADLSLSFSFDGDFLKMLNNLLVKMNVGFDLTNNEKDLLKFSGIDPSEVETGGWLVDLFRVNDRECYADKEIIAICDTVMQLLNESKDGSVLVGTFHGLSVTSTGREELFFKAPFYLILD